MAVISHIQVIAWKSIATIAVASSVCVVVFILFCAWCFKKKKKFLESRSDDHEANLYEDDTSISKLPLLKNDDFSFLNNGSRNKINPSPAKSTSSSSNKITPNQEKKKFVFDINSLPKRTNECTNYVQPPLEKNKDLGGSYDTIVSSWSSIPNEPDPSTERGEDLGSIYFSISYDVYGLVLKLTIQKAVNLPAKDISGSSDPYVKVLLLPDRKNKLETRVKRKKLNPIWNEVFTFEGFPYQKLLQRSVYLQVLDYDRFSRNDPIGEIEVALSDIELQSEPVPFVKKLKPCKGSTDYLGDLLISMCYNPTSCRISISIIKCSNLKKMDITGSCDPYIKIYLIYSGKRIDKKKTTIKKRDLNPVWNENFEFDVPIDKIREISFVLTVIDFDRILPNESIGQVTIGYRTAGQSLKHWTDMMNHPRKPIAMWHKIIKI
ncbi:synaptotagmin-7 [Hydra vulgaris]|uniref:Synaptotagmin-7 n=1 Tax=Hydra vulgaris TaxID=6087 RepID=T2MIM6_HYDVU|nr:synaptotagmin-7 [Hydra vulgaris]